MPSYIPDIDTFLRKLELQFDGMIPDTLQKEMKFRELEQWSSMQSLIIISFLDLEYGVLISAEELRKSATFAELYNTVLSKIK